MTFRITVMYEDSQSEVIMTLRNAINETMKMKENLFVNHQVIVGEKYTKGHSRF